MRGLIPEQRLVFKTIFAGKIRYGGSSNLKRGWYRYGNKLFRQLIDKWVAC